MKIMNKFVTKEKINTFILLLMPLFLLADGGSNTNPLWAWIMDNILVILTVLVILGAFLALWKAMGAVTDNQQRTLLSDQGIEIPEEEVSDNETFISRLYKKAWSLIPIDREGDIDLGHDYDGIRELDNKLPPWWVYLFYITIFFGIGYWYIYQRSDIGARQEQEYIASVKLAEKQKLEYLARTGGSINENNVKLLEDDSSLDNGKEIYLTNCAACHGQLGEGGVGPNMTDEYWIHGGGISNVFKTIKYGVPEKGMISWKSQLKPKSIQKVASFILSLQGTNPPNGKEPQGDKWVDEDK